MKQITKLVFCSPLCKLSLNRVTFSMLGSSSSASVVDHRMMRMVSISDSSQGSRPASSAVGSNTSRPRSASQPRSSFQSVKNEVSLLIFVLS